MSIQIITGCAQKVVAASVEGDRIKFLTVENLLEIIFGLDQERRRLESEKLKKWYEESRGANKAEKNDDA